MPSGCRVSVWVSVSFVLLGEDVSAASVCLSFVFCLRLAQPQPLTVASAGFKLLPQPVWSCDDRNESLPPSCFSDGFVLPSSALFVLF